MKHLIYLVGITLSITIMYSSCSKNNEEVNDEIGQLLNEKIIGTWSYYSGDTISGIIFTPKNNVYSQELSFISNGNFSEIDFTSYKNEEQQGNWRIVNNMIVFNNWDGDVIKDTIIICNLSENELSVKFQNKNIIYKRTEWLYDSVNFCNEILGFWKTMDIGFPRHTYLFKSDGTVGHHDYVWENIGGYGVHPWSYNPKTRELTTSQPTTSSDITTSKVEFINKYYLRWIQTFTRE